MQRVIFTIKNAFLGLTHKKLLNVLVILSVAVGFLFPVYSISNMNYIQKNYGTPPYKDVEHTVIADFFIKAEEESSMNEKMLKWSEQIKKVGFFASYNAVMEYKDESYVGYVSGCNSSFLEVSNTILASGRFPTKEEMENGANVCLVTSTSGHGYKIGSIVNIGGTDFKIIGIFRDIHIYGGVLMPYNALYTFVKGKSVQHKAYLQTEEEPKVSEISSEVRNSAEQTQFVSLAVDDEAVLHKSFKEYMSEAFKKSSIVLLFSIIGFTLIMVGRMISEQYILGVKTAVGATRVQLFLDSLFQNYLLIQIGAAIALLIYKCLFVINDSDSFGLFDGTVIAETEIVCIVMTLFVTGVGFVPILRCPVSELFRKSRDRG